jgi:tetratricopeptide (TPR) repeat protein
MEEQIIQPINNEALDNLKDEKKKTPKNSKFKWWQSFLMLIGTLVFSVVVAYFISDKYFWSNIDMKRVNEQLDHYKTLVDAQPNDPAHRVNLGYTYFLKNDNDEAIKQFKVALDLDKKYYDAYLNLAIVYNDEDRLDDSLKAAQKAVELAPRDYKGQLQKGMVYRKLKMYDEALESLNQANQLMPGNTDIIYEIGLLAEEQGMATEAADIYKEALSYDPLHKNSLDGLNRVASNDSK